MIGIIWALSLASIPWVLGQACIPPPGLFCCPPVGARGLPLNNQQVNPYNIFCEYGSLTQRVGRTECVYSTLNGVGSGSTSPSCPPQAPINSIYPGLCPFTAQIQPYDSAAKCVDVRDDNQSDGTPVQIYDCNGSEAQQWLFDRGDTVIRLAGTNFCLDAGTAPANGVGMKIWTCIDNLPAQSWVYLDYNQIVLGGTNLCLDLTDGNLINGNQLQIWECSGSNTNQIWL